MAESSPQPEQTQVTIGYLISQFIATGLYSGYSPFAPGTAGSIVGILFYLIPGFEHLPLFLIIIAATFCIAIPTSTKLSRRLGEDPPVVVIDEVVGMWISLVLLPKAVLPVLLAFFFFRVYDIIKPFPAKQLERLPHGWGIMLDDVMCGIYANLTVQLAVLVFHW
jgi:phosphatidylglycerophosphatase A